MSLTAPAICVPLYTGFTRVFFKDRYAEYTQLRRQKCESDRHDLRMVVRGTTALAIPMMVLCADWYFTARQEGVARNRFLGFGESFRPHDSVVDIRMSPCTQG